MFLTSLFRAATPENPRFSLNDPNAWEALGVATSSTGQRISRETAYTHSPWWRGINLISADVAKLPLHIYRRKGDGKERAVEHPSYKLLRRKPNPYQQAFIFKRTLTGHALSQGNGYAYITRRGDASVEDLTILSPDSTFPVKENGRLWYVTKLNGDENAVQMRKLPAEDVLHIKGFGFDGFQGYSVIEKAREVLGLGMAQRKYSAVFFRNDARAAVVLTTPASLDEPTRNELRDGWNRMHSGLENAHKTAIMDRGLEPKVISANAKESQLTEGMQFGVREVANFLGIPPHKLGDPTMTSYASLEQANQSYLDEAVDPWLVCWEDECWDKLLTEQEKDADTHFVEFMRNALVRANLNDRGNYYRTATGGRPWMTPDEVRGAENMNELGGEAGELLTPLNMGQGGADNEERPAPPPGKPKPPQKKGPPSDDDDEEDAKARLIAAHRPLLQDGVVRVLRRMAASAEKAAKTPKAFPDWVGAIEKDHGESIRKILDPIGEACWVLRSDSEQQHAIRLPAEWIARKLRDAYDASTDATAAQLPAAVAAISAKLEAELPAEAVAVFLGGQQ